jgi:radical SAM superfamily enzyme YgiQ (UPF0313 family)
VKVSFLNASPNLDLEDRERKKGIASFPPLGILYLSTLLEEEGVDVSVLDQPAKGFTMEETINWIEKENPDLLGFSAVASSGRNAALICKIVKERNPNIINVLGNYYATFNAERILKKYPAVDIIVRGEGENTIIELLECLEKKKDLKKVLGITFRRGEKIVSTPERPLIRDLDALPFPNRKLIDSFYHCIIAEANVAPKKFTSVVSSRGCVFNCRFCSCSKFARGIWRQRSVENTLEELHLLASEGYKQFIFVDDSFTLNQKRAIKLCQAMRKEKIDMEWICEGRVDNLSSELAREIERAGCKILYFGIESGNQRILDYYNKQTTIKQSEIAVKRARKVGIDVIIGSFIVGAPDESREEIKNTIEFAKNIPIDFPQFNILGIYPGTEIWDEFERGGFLKEGDYWETGIAVSELCPTAVPLNETKRMIHEGFKDFIWRPSYILKQIGRTVKSSYRLNVLRNNLGRIDDILDSVKSIT